MNNSKSTDPTFPPLMNGFGVSVPDQPFSYAVNGARYGALEAGNVVWARNTNVMDWAIVLEPDVPLASALQMAPLAMVAMGDCIGALTPPQVGLMFSWPGTILVNGGHAGVVEIAASAPDLEAVPAWIVVHVTVRLKGDDRHEPGERPDVTSLDEEGCPGLSRNKIIESYSRHFMTWLNTWNDDGFHPVHSAWLFRMHGLQEDFSLDLGDRQINGLFTGLDEDGNLLLKSADSTMSIVTLAEAHLGLGAAS